MIGRAPHLLEHALGEEVYEVVLVGTDPVVAEALIFDRAADGDVEAAPLLGHLLDGHELVERGAHVGGNGLLWLFLFVGAAAVQATSGIAF